jgi:hypothetical protein
VGIVGLAAAAAGTVTGLMNLSERQALKKREEAVKRREDAISGVPLTAVPTVGGTASQAPSRPGQ